MSVKDRFQSAIRTITNSIFSMPANSGTKLFKLASKVNISKDEIVDYLKTKGFEVENKPGTSLSDEQVALVEDKFSKQADRAEKTREKIVKMNQTRKKSDAAVSLQSKEDERIAIEKQREIEIAAEKKRVDDEKKSKKKEIEDVTSPAVEQTVDSSVVDVVTQTETVEVVESKAVEPSKERLVIPLPPKQKHKIVEKEFKADDLPKAEVPVEVEKDSEIASVEAEPASASTTETSEDAIVDESAIDGEQSEGDDESGSEPKKRKRKKNVVMSAEPGKMPQLRGLTVLGKIDLPRPGAQSNKQDKSKGARDAGNRDRREGGFRERQGGDAARGRREFDRNQPPRPGFENRDRPKPSTGDRAIGDALSRDGNKFGTGPKFGAPKFGPPAAPADSKAAKKKDEKKKKGKSLRETITEEEVTRAIRETLSGMDESSSVSMRSKLKKKIKLEREEKEQKRQEELERESMILRVTEFLSTAELANFMDVSPAEIITKCFSLGLMVSINQRLDKDTIQLIADDYGFQVEFVNEKDVAVEEDVEDAVETLKPRAPIVTIMGHVDHGKTSLLDYIRKANVVAGEAGGITQHIGAYKVVLPNGKAISFLDTPGHEAFTAMRARGAQVTDIVILVVSADDNVMPQTIEAISHAQAANVPIVVAINKIDKEDAKPDQIKQQLSNHGVLVEEWGGKYQAQEISAKKGINIDSLLEKVLLEAEVLDLKANPDRDARGTVIESHVDKGKGNVATIMVQKGTMRVGDSFVVGSVFGRVRAMFDERGNKIDSAEPSTPVQVTGFDGLPESGDILIVSQDESHVREVATQRSILRREQQLRQVRHITLDDISSQISKGGVKELRLIIKADMGGSLEALSDSLLKLSRDEVKVSVIYKGVGSITESDVMLAAASNAVVVGFQVTLPQSVRKISERESVDVRLYSIIYDCINEVQLALEGMLSPDIKEEITATVEVRQVFKISKVGAVAGSYVTSGTITRNDKIRILRNGFEIFKGTLQSLKRVKDDAREVHTGFECGIVLNGFNDFEEGDIIEAYKSVEVKRKLS